MKIDFYFLVARIIPAALSGIPLFVFQFFVLRTQLSEFWNALLGAQIVSNVTISMAFLIAFIMLSRYLSKVFFEVHMFDDGRSFPTTQFLLHADTTYSQGYTSQIHERIRNDFGIQIPTEVQEASDEAQSRKLIREAVDLIRAKVGKGRLVNQHVAEYGFWRNLAGGSVLGLFLAAADLLVFWLAYPNNVALLISIALVGVYSLHLIFAKRLIVSHGRYYAKVLIQEYMASS